MKPLCLGRWGTTGNFKLGAFSLEIPRGLALGSQRLLDRRAVIDGTAVHRCRPRDAELLREGIAATGSRSGGSGRRDPVSAGGPGTGVTFSTDCFIAVRRPKDDRRGRRAGR